MFKSRAAARGRMRTAGLVWGVIMAAIVPPAGSAETCSSHTECPNEGTRANYCDTADNCHYCAWEAATDGIPYWSSCDATNNGNGDAIVSVEYGHTPSDRKNPHPDTPTHHEACNSPTSSTAPFRPCLDLPV